MKLSLVVPCYNEELNVRPFYEACLGAFDGKVGSYEIVFINDGSRDGTWRELLRLRHEASVPLTIINFSRNFGKEAAMLAGLENAKGDFVTVIDADLQQRPEVVLEMLEILRNEPDTDCVCAYQEKRREGRITSFFKKSFYKIINKVCETDFRDGASDFRTFRRTMVEAILSMREYHRFSKGIFSWVGFNTHYIPYTVMERNAGKSSWNFASLTKYAFEGIISFSTLPLKLSTGVGSLMAALSLIYMIAVIIQKLCFGIAVPGYPTLVVLILLIGGIQLITLGIIGEYIARIYIQGKNRPVYIVKEKIGSEEDNKLI